VVRFIDLREGRFGAWLGHALIRQRDVAVRWFEVMCVYSTVATVHASIDVVYHPAGIVSGREKL